MAKYVPLSAAEENNDSSIFASIGAGLVSGLIKTVEGVVSLGAELIDLGADSNVAADVEKFFDKVNIFEDTADDRVVGKLTEESDNNVKIKTPLTLVMGGKGLGLQQYLFTGEPDKAYTFNTDSLMVITKTVKQFADLYQQQTSGIVTAPPNLQVK